MLCVYSFVVLSCSRVWNARRCVFLTVFFRGGLLECTLERRVCIVVSKMLLIPYKIRSRCGNCDKSEILQIWLQDWVSKGEVVDGVAGVDLNERG